MIKVQLPKMPTFDALLAIARRPEFSVARTSLTYMLFCLSFAALSSGPSTACLAQDLPEIEIAADAQTTKDYYQTCLQFHLHELELYQKNSTDSPEVNKLVEPFIRYSAGVAAEKRISYYPNPISQKDIEVAEAAMASDSDDPIFLSYAALFCERQREFEKALDFGTRSIEQFDKLKTYPRGLRFVLILRFVSMKLEADEFVKKWRGMVDKWYQEALEEMPEFLAYGASRPDGLRPTFGLFTEISAVLGNDRNPQRVGLITNALFEYASNEKADPWLVQMTQGHFAERLAWSYRGGGYANEVKAEGAKDFAALMKNASKYCRAAHALRPEFPEAAAALIGIAKAGGDEESTSYWFEQSIAADADNCSAYSQILDSLLPRWGGSHADIIAFGRKCNDTKRYDTLVPYWLPLSLVYINQQDSVSWKSILSRPELVDKMLKCCEKLLEDPSRSTEQKHGERLHILTMQLCVAMKAERFAKAVEVWNKLGDEEPNEHLLHVFDISGNYDRSRCHAYAEFGDQLKQIRPSTTFEARADDETKRKVISVYSDLVEKSVDPKSKLYLNRWVDQCQNELDFEDGKWVELEFTSDNAMWQVFGDWTFNEEEKAMYLKSNGKGFDSFLSHHCVFPGPKEVRAEVAVKNRITWAYELGVIIGRGHQGKCFWVDSTRQTIGNENGYASGWDGISGPISKKRNELRVKYWNRKSYELWVDGFRQYTRTARDAEPASDLVIGIGLPALFSSAGEGMVANVRVRKLTEPPLPRLNKHDKRLKYFNRLIDQNPDRYDYVFERGVEWYYLNQVPEAIADFELAMKNSPDEHEYHHFLGDLLVRTGRVEEGLKQLEMSDQAFPATRFFGQSLLAFHLATIEDDQLRDVDRATEILKELFSQSSPTADSVLALAAVQIEAGDLDRATSNLKVVPYLDRDTSPWLTVHRPTVHLDGKRLAKKIIEKAKPVPFTLLSLKADPKTSTPSTRNSGAEYTTNDSFAYSPESAAFNFPVMDIQLEGTLQGFQSQPGSHLGKSRIEGNPDNAVVLNYFVDAPHVVVAEKPEIVVDLYGRHLPPELIDSDNDIEVLLLNEGKEIARKSKLAIPDDTLPPYVRAKFAELKPGTKIDQIKIVARPGGEAYKAFCLQEIRAAAVAPIEK